MNNLQNYTADQTPIEIALGIDSEGRTTAKKLYAFLELNPAVYARWCKTNILQNQFAEENVDYWAFNIDVERNYNPNPTQDYKLTASFAKKLSMKGNGERAEQARNYFVKVEELKKQETIDRKQLSPQTLLMNIMIENISKQELEQKRQAEKIEALEQKAVKVKETVQTVAETFVREGTEQSFSEWVSRSLSRIARSPNYPNYEFDDKVKQAWIESYSRLTRAAHCNLNILVNNAVKRAEKSGATKAQTKAITKLSVIMSNVRLKGLYKNVIREMLCAYCVDYKGDILQSGNTDLSGR